MATTTLRNGASVITHTVTTSWTDMITSIAGAASVDGFVRNLTIHEVLIVKGGATAPDAGSSGELLLGGGASYCNADHIWVRTNDLVGSTLAFETL